MQKARRRGEQGRATAEVRRAVCDCPCVLRRHCSSQAHRDMGQCAELLCSHLGSYHYIVRGSGSVHSKLANGAHAAQAQARHCGPSFLHRSFATLISPDAHQAAMKKNDNWRPGGGGGGPGGGGPRGPRITGLDRIQGGSGCEYPVSITALACPDRACASMHVLNRMRRV